MDEATLREMWGALALRGAAAILFGIAAVFWPGLTLVTLVYLFAAFILVSGLVNLVVGLTNLGAAGTAFWPRVLTMLLGVGQIGVGVYLLRHPLLTFETFILVAGITLIVHALVDLFSGIFGEGSAAFHAEMVVGGLITGLAGVLLLLQPESGGVAFVWILGLYALIAGPLLVALAFDAKRAASVVPSGRTRPAR